MTLELHWMIVVWSQEALEATDLAHKGWTFHVKVVYVINQPMQISK